MAPSRRQLYLEPRHWEREGRAGARQADGVHRGRWLPELSAPPGNLPCVQPAWSEGAVPQPLPYPAATADPAASPPESPGFIMFAFVAPDSRRTLPLSSFIYLSPILPLHCLLSSCPCWPSISLSHQPP